jgi:hypothetical protein
MTESVEAIQAHHQERSPLSHVLDYSVTEMSR